MPQAPNVKGTRGAFGPRSRDRLTRGATHDGGAATTVVREDKPKPNHGTSDANAAGDKPRSKIGGVHGKAGMSKRAAMTGASKSGATGASDMEQGDKDHSDSANVKPGSGSGSDKPGKRRGVCDVCVSASGEGLTKVPATITRRRKLQEMDLSNNGLTDLPREMKNFKCLKILDLSNNKLTTVPDCLSTITTLESLDLRGNTGLSLNHSLITAHYDIIKVDETLTSPPYDIYKQGKAQALEYYTASGTADPDTAPVMQVSKFLKKIKLSSDDPSTENGSADIRVWGDGTDMGGMSMDYIPHQAIGVANAVALRKQVQVSKRAPQKPKVHKIQQSHNAPPDVTTSFSDDNSPTSPSTNFNRDHPSVFISYNWSVQNDVKELRSCLHKAGLSCWIDVERLTPGCDKDKEISQGIRHAKVIVSCITKKYEESDACAKEVALASDMKKEIIPVMFEKVPWPLESSMCMAFAGKIYLPYTGRTPTERTEQHQRLITSLKSIVP